MDISYLLKMQGIQRIAVVDAALFLGFAYENRLLLLAGNTTGTPNPGVPDFNMTGALTLTTMDISAVRNAIPITTVVTNVQTTGTYNVQALGGNLFAVANYPPPTDVNGPGSLMIVHASNPQQPILYPHSWQFGLTGIMSVNGYSWCRT